MDIPDEYVISRRADGSVNEFRSEWFNVPAEKGARPCHPKPMHVDDVSEPTHLAHNIMLSLFPDSYPHPFPDSSDGTSRMSRTPNEWGDAPRTLVELQMCALSAAIRDKPEWYTKMSNPTIRAKWRKEALHQTRNAAPGKKLTEAMVDYVLDELEGYVKLRDDATGIEMACYERVWKSDALVPGALRRRLLDSVAMMENVPEPEKDWHPGSKQQVLNLVHPSLWPICYDDTWVRTPTGSFELISPPGVSRAPEADQARTLYSGQSTRGNAVYISRHYSWLPSDFIVDEESQARLVPGTYINNIHPDDHAGIYPVIDDLVTLAIPMFERVLSDLRRPLTKPRMIMDRQWVFVDSPQNRFEYREAWAVGCIYRNAEGRSTGVPQWPPGKEAQKWTNQQYEKYVRSIPKHLPEALPKYEGALEAIKKTVSLAGSTIQIIVKMANIVLTPQKPSYPGGQWHVEGMFNERIVSTFIYYYDEENVTESRLAFRTSVVEPHYHGQDDDTCTSTLYGVRRDSPLVQDLGSVKTSKGRCIAFPNIYQHQVQPFKLKNTAKPGHRKIVALFLVDPTEKIPSTTTIAPQQYHWIVEAAREVLKPRLPVELVDLVSEYISAFTWDRAAAEQDRLELIKERSYIIKKNTEDKFSVGFNMCEH